MICSSNGPIFYDTSESYTGTGMWQAETVHEVIIGEKLIDFFVCSRTIFVGQLR